MNMIIKVFWAILVLLSGEMLSSAQETVIAEGDPIRLDCSDLFQQRVRLRWFAGGHSSLSAYTILTYSELTPGSGTWVTRRTPGTKYHDRINYSTRGVCIISPSRKDDDVQYYCERDYVLNSIKRTFTYKIIARPKQPPTVTPGPTARSQEGTYIQLTCQLQEDTGEPFTYRWSRLTGVVRGQVDPTRGTLTFSASVRTDVDTYTCRASNRAGYTEASVQLFVDFPPTIFGITSYNTGDILYSGDDKEMICRTDGGRPLPTLSWNCVGQTGANGGTGNIRIISFSAEVLPNWHNQNCVCTATQEIPTMTQTRSVTFNVYFPPTSPSLTLVDSPWLENTPSTSRCHVTRGNPATSTFKWYKGQGSAPIVTGTAGQMHEFHYTFTKDDNGISLACSVENQHTLDKGGSQARAAEIVNVEYSPRVTLTSGDAIIRRKENQPLTLTCTADINPKAVTNGFQWTKDESPLSQGPEVQISSVKKTDSGVYKCTVTVQRANNKGELSGHARATVDIKYFHLTGSPDQKVTEHDNLVLNCTVDSNPSNFTFNKWTHINGGKETELSSTSFAGNVAYLELSPVKYTVGGTYRCEAGNNIYPKVTAQQNITVFYTPKCDTHSAAGEIRYAFLRRSVSFGVIVHAYPPDITFTWRALVNESVWQNLSDDDKYFISNTVTSSLLGVRNVSVTDYTHYMLYATNNVRKGASFSFTLMPQERPQIKEKSLVIQRHGSRAYLTWERPGGTYDAQRIEQHDNTGQRQKGKTGVCTPPTCQVSANLTVDTTSYNVTGLVPGRTYQFVLVLYYKGDEVQRVRFIESVKIDPYELNSGAIVGGVMGGLLVTVMISVLVLVYFHRRKQGHKESGICKMPEGENTTEICSQDKAYELLNRPVENVKMSTSDEDKSYQELQKATHYDYVERKNTLQEHTYEELSKPTNGATNGKTLQDEARTTSEKLQDKN